MVVSGHWFRYFSKMTAFRDLCGHIFRYYTKSTQKVANFGAIAELVSATPAKNPKKREIAEPMSVKTKPTKFIMLKKLTLTEVPP
jgi:hypothetical protein